MEWVNWSGSQRASPRRFVMPRSREELATRRSPTGPAPIRVAGAGHSFSGGVADRGHADQRSTHLHRVLDADAGVRPRPRRGRHPPEGARRASCTRAGWRCRTSATSTSQSLAGALATGTHGTGTRLPNLSGQVESVELILADGSERTLDGGDELLRRARVASARSA